jgi:hypothetical protein
MLEIFNKILAAALGFILYPIVTLAVALLHLVGFACLILAAALLLPSFVSSITLSFDLIRQGNPSDTMTETSFFSYLMRDLGLRAAILGVGSLALAVYASTQAVFILASPFTGIKAGFQGGFSGLLSGIKDKLFNHFGLNVFINNATAQNPEFLTMFQGIAQNAGVNLGQITLSEAALTDQEINPLTYRLNQEHDSVGYDHAVASWTNKLSSVNDATCALCLDIPEQNNIVLLQKQYFHNSTWNPIDNQTWVFSHSDLTQHLKTSNSLNPMNRANLRDTTSKHTHAEEACDTRWRIIPFCAQNSTLVSTLQALHVTEPVNAATEQTNTPTSRPRRGAHPEIPERTSHQIFNLFSATLNPFQAQTTAPHVANEPSPPPPTTRSFDPSNN